MNVTHHISDTALAAALATLGIGTIPGQPASRVVDTLTSRDHVEFLFLDGTTHPEGTPNFKTEAVAGLWGDLARLKREDPGHPLVAMAAGLEARKWLLRVVSGEIFYQSAGLPG